MLIILDIHTKKFIWKFTFQKESIITTSLAPTQRTAYNICMALHDFPRSFIVLFEGYLYETFKHEAFMCESFHFPNKKEEENLVLYSPLPFLRAFNILYPRLWNTGECYTGKIIETQEK